eukprot:GFUD01137705.1.p1 GENE.GFUD01137705.1~~GFUD01137705.1.p1  ORF type:complete len:508 (-),score=128.83 GFUD01137705.1:562-2085(-)
MLMALHTGNLFAKGKNLKQATNIVLRCQSTVAMVDHGSTQTKQKAKPLSEMPSPPGWPIVGHLPLMMKIENKEKMDKMFDRLRGDHGDIYRIYMPGQGNMVIIFRPEDVKAMYAGDGKSPKLPGFDMFSFIRKTTMKDRYTTAGLINNTEDWYEVRHKVQQDMMRPKSALYYLSEMEEIAIELADKIQEVKGNDGMLDPYALVQEYALEAVGCVFMGARLGALKGVGDGKQLIEILTKSMALTMDLIFLPKLLAPFLPSYKKFVKYQEEAFDICKKHVDEAIAKVKDTDDTVIAKLVRKCGKDSAIPLIMGIDALQVGIDTTGTSAAFLLYHLANNPDKQELLYQEICDNIGPDGRMTESALAKMKYMKACQIESQRILPATFGTRRRVETDIVIAGYQIPKGTSVIRVGSTSSNDPTSFVNPEKFLPERWLRGCPERHSAHSFANIPWGHGARACIGQRFAKLELYVLMVKLVQRYRMEYTGDKVETVTHLVSMPDKPINIKFIKR